jgi:hypothetical protein
MGASIYLRWPGLGAEEPIDHPGFGNDDTGYARWIERVAADGAVAACLRDSGFGSLLHVFPADFPDKKIKWVEARKLKDDANRLAEEVLRSSALGVKCASLYKHESGESPEELLAQDRETWPPLLILR